MKKVCFLFFFAVFFSSLGVNASNPTPYKVRENGFKKISVEFSTPDLLVENQKNGYSVLTMKDYLLSREVGKPALPVLVKMVEIPLCDSVIVSYKLGNCKVFSADEIGLKGQIVPAQPSYSKSDNGIKYLHKDSALYSTNAFYSEAPVKLEQIGVLRCANLATVFVSTVQYNPVTNEVRVYESIEAEFTFVNADVAATNRMKELHANPYFPTEDVVINPVAKNVRDAYSAPVKYVIVSNQLFNGQLEQFVQWKKRKGFLVEVKYVESSTTYAAIQSYLKSLYTNATKTNPAPTFVLLVGDVAQIPTEQVSSTMGNHPSDMRYVDWTNDNIPDCYIGRFSAANLSHVKAEIEKTLVYEQVTMADPSYLESAVMIAGEEDGGYDSYPFGYTHANTAIQYLTATYVSTSNGYKTVSVFKNPHASTATSTIKSLLNQGVGLANYTAHGDVDRWYCPSFKASNVSSMTNEGKYGLMIGNCCLSNKFDDTSLGETLLRASKKGAVGYIGGTNSTYWDEDVYWAIGARSYISYDEDNPTSFAYQTNQLGMYDRLFHTHGEAFSKRYTTFGGMVMAGNLAVQASSTDKTMKRYYWEIYSLVGDPSVMTWLKKPQKMVVTTDPIASTATSVNVHAVPYAYVALTDNGELLAATFADAFGEAKLNFSQRKSFDKVELAASAQNYMTNFSKLKVVATGIEENTDEEYGVTPNPAGDFVQVKAPAGQLIRLYDVNGRFIREIMPTEAVTRMDVSDLSTGYYFLKSGQTTMKLIKK